jgi:sodium transport system permease protein
MSFAKVKLIYLRELRDQLRDRRTLFTIFVLPLLLYPILGMTFVQITQFMREHPTRIWVLGAEELPPDVPLIEKESFAANVLGERDASLLKVTVAQDWKTDSAATAQEAAREAIKGSKFDAVLFFPPGFGKQLDKYREGEVARRNGDKKEPLESESPPQPEIFRDSASDRSRIAFDRVQMVLSRWRETLVQDNLKQRHVPPEAIRPFEVKTDDVAAPGRANAAIWSKVLPFVLLIWALTGAFYPAIDLCAGEKERGTLETLLSSPAQRSEIVWGKLLTVMTFSVATALLNLMSMGGTGSFIMSQLTRLGGLGNAQVAMGPPPWTALCWLPIALIPISALFSALSLAVASFARSSKEGQYYLMPLLLISMPLMMLPLLPTAELDLGSALIPITGVMLLLRAAMEGQYWEALRYCVPVFGVTAVCCLLAVRWAIDQFNNESVLFRESERLEIGLLVRRMFHGQEDLPTFGQAMLCGILLLVIRFFASLSAQMPEDWPGFVRSTLVMQVALIATPAALMAIILTKKPLRALSLGRPSFWLTLPVAALIAIALHPAMLTIAGVIQRLYPISPEMGRQIQELVSTFEDAPLAQLLLVVALLPAFCEELAFRGFILSGLRRMGHKWGAIALAAIFFGLAHGILQQSLSACLVGMLLGYIAVKTGSLWPAVAYHAVHNSLSMIHSRLDADHILSQPLLAWAFVKTTVEGQVTLAYSWPAVIVGAAVGGLLLLWLKSLPYRHLAEEDLQEALDHQTATLEPPAKMLPAKAPL